LASSQVGWPWVCLGFWLFFGFFTWKWKILLFNFFGKTFAKFCNKCYIRHLHSVISNIWEMIDSKLSFCVRTHWKCVHSLHCVGSIVLKALNQGLPKCGSPLASRMQLFKPVHAALWAFRKIIYLFFIFYFYCKRRNIVKWYGGG